MFTRVFTLWILLCVNYCLSVIVKDIYTPEICENINTDVHLLIDYKFVLANNSIGLAITAPNQLFYVQLSDLNEDLVIVKNLKEMCLNSTRSLQFESSFGVDFSPFLPLNSTYSRLSELMTVIIHISTVTKQSDFSIFDAINSGNSSMVLDLIEEHRGINAVDQWGQSALMFAVSSQSLLLFSALMNTRRPTVNVNLMKSSGFTALFYAVEKAPFGIVQALLRRGADPNIAVLQEGSRGNTPLHFACLLEGYKNAALLLGINQ
jgi:ankyrin repeat protein